MQLNTHDSIFKHKAYVTNEIGFLFLFCYLKPYRSKKHQIVNLIIEKFVILQ